MRKLLAAFVALAAIVGVFAMVTPKAAEAQEAFVLNSGRDGLTCTLSGAFPGQGHATLVLNNGGQIMFQCTGTLNVPGPASAILISATGPFGTVCDPLVITPSGHFSATCQN
jgi:hypothetical protein